MPIKKLVRFFTSLKLTVVLLAFAIVLVFVGTLAQVLQRVQERVQPACADGHVRRVARDEE